MLRLYLEKALTISNVWEKRIPHDRVPKLLNCQEGRHRRHVRQGHENFKNRATVKPLFLRCSVR